MDPVFRDEQVEELFTDRGYVVIDALDAEAVAALADLHDATAASGTDGFQFSMQMGPGDAKQLIRAGIRAAYERWLAPALHEQVIVADGFVAKQGSGESTIAGHVDWSMVDETRQRSVNAWIPLCDTDASNGALAVVAGSQRLPLTIRGSATPVALAAPPDVVAKHLTLVPMRAGQAILYEPRVIHASASNMSGRPRVAAAMSLVSAGTQPLHYVGGLDPDGSLRQFEVDAEFFHAYAIDPEIGRSRELPSLLSGRPSRNVRPTPPITTEQIDALSPRRRTPRVRRLLQRR